MRYFVTFGERVLEVELGPEGVRLEGELVEADLVEVDGTQVRTLLLDHRSHWVLASREDSGEWRVHLSGHQLQGRAVDERIRAIREMTGGRGSAMGPMTLRAPMPGLVVKVEVEEGDQVYKGQGLVIVEAMKMENELESFGEGRVSRILVVPGQTVNKDQVLVELEPLGSPPGEGDT